MSAVALRYFGTIDDDPAVINPLVDPGRFHQLVYGQMVRCPIESHASLIVLGPIRLSGVSRAQAMLHEMTGLDADWEAIGSEPPNQQARVHALRVLDESFLMGRRRPSYVTTSAEGGIGIVYRTDTQYAAIECLNSGELWLLWYDEGGNPRSREIENNQAQIADALRQVSALHADA